MDRSRRRRRPVLLALIEPFLPLSFSPPAGDWLTAKPGRNPLVFLRVLTASADIPPAPPLSSLLPRWGRARAAVPGSQPQAGTLFSTMFKSDAS